MLQRLMILPGLDSSSKYTNLPFSTISLHDLGVASSSRPGLWYRTKKINAIFHDFRWVSRLFQSIMNLSSSKVPLKVFGKR